MNKPKPPTAWVFFMKYSRPNVLQTHPNAGFGEISSYVSQLWNELSVQDKEPFFVASRNAKKAMEITGKSYDMSQWNGLEDNEVDFNQLERIVAKKKEQQQNSNNKKRAREEDEDEEEDDEQEFPSVPGSTTNNNTDASFFSSFVDDPQSKRSRIDINQINETDEDPEPYMLPGFHPRNRVYVARDNQTPSQIAKELNIEVASFVKYNRPFLKGLSYNSKLMEQTRLKVPPGFGPGYSELSSGGK